jgi:hypothetical protein
LFWWYFQVFFAVNIALVLNRYDCIDIFIFFSNECCFGKRDVRCSLAQLVWTMHNIKYERSGVRNLATAKKETYTCVLILILFVPLVYGCIYFFANDVVYVPLCMVWFLVVFLLSMDAYTFLPTMLSMCLCVWFGFWLFWKLNYAFLLYVYVSCHRLNYLSIC